MQMKHQQGKQEINDDNSDLFWIIVILCCCSAPLKLYHTVAIVATM